jgi:hypothetical protein
MTSPHPTISVIDAEKQSQARSALGRNLGLMGLKRLVWAGDFWKGVRGKVNNFNSFGSTLGLTGLTGLKFPPTRASDVSGRARGKRKVNMRGGRNIEPTKPVRPKSAYKHLISLYYVLTCYLCFQAQLQLFQAH